MLILTPTRPNHNAPHSLYEETQIKQPENRIFFSPQSNQSNVFNLFLNINFDPLEILVNDSYLQYLQLT